jgi:opacity protein-like surface antigen
MKKLAVVAILALSCLSIASAKNYEVTFSGPIKAGNVQLQAGVYHLKVNGSNAVFTQDQTSKSFTVPVKVENGDTKFDQTRVDATKNNGTDVITDIKLGGSSTIVEFTY